jgi:general secretion pathway protein L
VVGLNAWAWKQSTQIVNQRAQMTQLLTQSFPEVKVVVDAPLQMQRELPILRQTQGQLSGQDFESILSRFSSVAGMNASPNAIEYVANEVQIKGANLSGEQLNELLPRFQYAGLNVRSDARALIVSHSDAVVTAAAGAKR